MLLYNNKSIPKLTDNYLLSITDRAGNESPTINITIHTHNFVDGVCSICGEGIASAGELEKWDYTLDDAAKKVTLNKYTGTDENVTVYSNYDVGGECYKTKLRDSVKEYNEYNVLMDMNLFTDNKTVNNIAFQKRIDTSNVKNMNSMFRSCSSLTSLDVSNLDTSNIEDMGNMFTGCFSLMSLDLNNWDTSNVKNMSWMFNECSSLTSIDVNSFDTSNVSTMNRMFASCKALISLDLSNFDTSKATRMDLMFSYCSKLESIYVSRDKWIINEECDKGYMFMNCSVSEVIYKDAA